MIYMIFYAVLCVAWFFLGTYQYGVWLAKQGKLNNGQWVEYYDTVIDTNESWLIAPFYKILAVNGSRIDEDLTVIGGAFVGFIILWFVLVLITALLISYPVVTLSVLSVIGGGVAAFAYGLSKSE